MSAFDSTLIKDFTTKCVFFNRATVRDEYGGYKNRWTDGAEFDAVIIEDDSTQAIVAGIEKNTDFIGVKVPNNVPLEFGSVFKRLKDGQTFRIRKEGISSPKMSNMGIKTLSAETWSPPPEELI